MPTAPGVDALGWIADPSTEIATWSLTVVPIHFGAGTRIKIADAFSRKCPVVSTRFGAFGYDVVDGRQLRLADTPESFVRACIELIRDRAAASGLAERAWSDFLEKWSWEAIAPRVQAAATDCLARAGRSRSQRNPP
jgi:glycosyltransferase involved in cell wall biosynthesis